MANNNYNISDGDLKTGNVVIFAIGGGGLDPQSIKCYGEVLEYTRGIVIVDILWADQSFIIGARMPITKTLVEGLSSREEVAAITVMDG